MENMEVNTMLKTKKRIKRLATLGLCLMMLISTGVTANAATKYPDTFSFSLTAKGDKKQTSSVKKTNKNTYACIDVTTCQNSSMYGLPYRLRSGTNGTEASLLYTMAGTGLKCPSYKNGYGQYNYNYYFRIQTDSNSLFNATVKGSWKS